jgi:uncharacterized protein
MKNIIDQFVNDKNIALIGVSRDQTKFGNALLKELTKRGYIVYPVHPELKEVEGTRCYAAMEDLPDKVKNMILVVQPKVTEEIVSQINPQKIQRVWMHRGMGKGSASIKAIEECKRKGIEVVYDFCPMMFISQKGFHGFHFWMRKTFGKIPSDFKMTD